MEQTIKISIDKKNRKYFAATLNGYKAKILVDENSQDLSLGTQELLVEDISKRSKFGTELIFKLAGQDKVNAWNNPVIVAVDFNKIFVERAKELGGKWDSENRNWSFSSLVEEEAEELDFIFGSEKIAVEITAKDSCYALRSSKYFMGIEIAKATGRDSGATVSDGVSLISGGVGSGGSSANWSTEIAEGSILRLLVPSEVYNKYKDDKEHTEDFDHRNFALSERID